MNRSYYLDLAARGARFPIGADLVLREKSDHEAILHDGVRLGQVLAEAARRYKTPLALALMDLTLEKRMLLERLGLPPQQLDAFHFDAVPTPRMLQKVRTRTPTGRRVRANIAALDYLAGNTDLVPVGMCIGPFSLTTKLIADPITPVYLSGSGVTASDDAEVAALERALEMALAIVLESIEMQANAGARAILIAEPAANKVYFSPKQLDEGSDAFDRYAIGPLRQVKQRLEQLGVDLLFHCCGELIDPMVRKFASLDPMVLSLGSSRKLWEDARLVPKSIVLYGNLPTKRFYSDEAITVEQVEQLARELIARMREVQHPFILGSECDVLSVRGAEQTIARKVQAFMNVW